MKNTTVTISVILGVILLGVLVFARPMHWNFPWSGQGQMTLNDFTYDNHHMNDDYAELYEIYPGDVAQKIQKGEDFILLDVRTQEEYREVHLENALLLPVEELSQQTLTAIGLGQDKKDNEIIIYCRSGARSKIAYDVMKSLGYTNLKSVSGGMIHWQEDNFPFTKTGQYTGPLWSSRGIQNQEVLSDAPQISIVSPFHDFGVIPQLGGTVSKDFVVKNTGEKNLEIGTITTSCSCTSATISQRSIAPNSSTTLTVVFDPNFHEEPLDVFKRTIFIPSNDPNTPEAEVVIQVDIDEGN